MGKEPKASLSTRAVLAPCLSIQAASDETEVIFP